MANEENKESLLKHLRNVPLVADGVASLQGLKKCYGWGLVLGAAEHTVKTGFDIASFILGKPPLRPIAYWIDGMAVNTVRSVESKFPITKMNTQELKAVLYKYQCKAYNKVGSSAQQSKLVEQTLSRTLQLLSMLRSINARLTLNDPTFRIRSLINPTFLPRLVITYYDCGLSNVEKVFLNIKEIPTQILQDEALLIKTNLEEDDRLMQKINHASPARIDTAIASDDTVEYIIDALKFLISLNCLCHIITSILNQNEVCYCPH